MCQSYINRGIQLIIDVIDCKMLRPGIQCTTNATTTTQKQSDYKVEQSSFMLIALFWLEIGRCRGRNWFKAWFPLVLTIVRIGDFYDIPTSGILTTSGNTSSQKSQTVGDFYDVIGIIGIISTLKVLSQTPQTSAIFTMSVNLAVLRIAIVVRIPVSGNRKNPQFLRFLGQVGTRLNGNQALKPGFHKANFDHDNDQFWVKTKRLMRRMTAQAHNCFVFCVVVVEFAVNGNQA